ncbi:hypothetical protein ACFXOL_22325 [Streptomyces californicus]|uniref:hypothetical protein n=1 Tax=Streptomyces californicus TaxID=67351 RepID=UPI003676CAB1
MDATELGDLLPLTGAEHVTGFESRRDTGEPGRRIPSPGPSVRVGDTGFEPVTSSV